MGSLTAMHQLLVLPLLLKEWNKEHGLSVTEAGLKTLMAVANLSKEKSVSVDEIQQELKDFHYPYNRFIIGNHLTKLSQAKLTQKEGKLRYRLTETGKAKLQLLDKRLGKVKAPELP